LNASGVIRSDTDKGAKPNIRTPLACENLNKNKMIQTTKGGLASVITAIDKAILNLEGAKQSKSAKTFYRVYDTQRGCYFAT
jgi:hypothetical protein